MVATYFNAPNSESILSSTLKRSPLFDPAIVFTVNTIYKRSMNCDHEKVGDFDGIDLWSVVNILNIDFLYILFKNIKNKWSRLSV